MTHPALALIRSFEGFRETPYWDVNALRTGYGSDTVTMPDGSVQRVTDGTRVTREDAERDLLRRVDTEFMPRAASAVGQEAWQRMSPDQQAALASITYNYGSLPGDVASAAQTGDPQATASAIRALGSHNDGVNRERREKEAAVFLGAGIEGGGDAAPSAAPDYSRLAYAYANGKMTPEDAALYEQGMAAGAFPQAKRKEEAPAQPDPMSIYAATAINRPRQAFQPVVLDAGPIANATPLRPFGSS